jgi:glucokinase
MLLAGDVGGTKTLLGLFERARDRPRPLVVREFSTQEFDSLDELTQVFLDDTGASESVTALCMGVAGPVNGLVARLSNVPWLVDLSIVAEQVGNCPLQLLNDLEAMAYAVPVLEPDELAVLQEGVAVSGGNAAIIAAGTGLGQSLLHNVNGEFVPSPTEGGHADFSARTSRELALVEHLTAIYGRVDNDRVISGPGLVNIFGFTHGVSGRATGRACRAIGPGVADSELAAAISASAQSGRCEQCGEALDMFIEAYGAEAGNLALRSMATAGVYLGGGIAPKMLAALESGAFLDAFRNKVPLTDLLRTIPVSVILNPRAGLLGAAVRAQSLID